MRKDHRSALPLAESGRGEVSILLFTGPWFTSVFSVHTGRLEAIATGSVILFAISVAKEVYKENYK